VLLLIIHVLVSIFLVAVILIQPGKGDAGIGFGSSSQSIFGSKGAGNFLTKITTVCAVVFICTSFFLTRGRLQDYNKSVISDSEPVQTETVPEEKAAAVPDTTKAKQPVAPSASDSKTGKK